MLTSWGYGPAKWHGSAMESAPSLGRLRGGLSRRKAGARVPMTRVRWSRRYAGGTNARLDLRDASNGARNTGAHRCTRLEWRRPESGAAALGRTPLDAGG